MSQRILLVEDNARLAEMLQDYLSGEGYSVAHADCGLTGLKRREREAFDAIVLDLTLPDMDGLDVCRRIRAAAATPILMLTARGNFLDRIAGFERGADDYLPKPFEPLELLARLRAILRRGKNAHQGNVLQFGRLEIDRDSREVRLEGLLRPLTAYQFDVLLGLAEGRGRVMTREALMDLANGENLDASDRSIDVQISRIRAAIEDDVKKPRRIITIRGAGYAFARLQD